MELLKSWPPSSEGQPLLWGHFVPALSRLPQTLRPVSQPCHPPGTPIFLPLRRLVSWSPAGKQAVLWVWPRLEGGGISSPHPALVHTAQRPGFRMQAREEIPESGSRWNGGHIHRAGGGGGLLSSPPHPHVEARKERKTSQRHPAKVSRKQESRSQPPAPWGQGKHRFSSVPCPQGHSAPGWFCLWGDKGGSCEGRTAPASDWRFWVLLSHPEMRRGCSRSPPTHPTPALFLHQMGRAPATPGSCSPVSFTTLPARAIPPVASRGLPLGSHFQDQRASARDGFP